MIPRTALWLTAGALVAFAGWPFALERLAPATTFTPAPVTADYLSRNRLIAFEEAIVRRQPSDQITQRMLALQYLQRFREQGDIGDVTRAENVAERSLRLQPQGNTAAQMALASAELDYHEFRPALTRERAALAGEPFNDNARAQIASLQMELGEYDAARRTLDAVTAGGPENPTVDAVVARLDELSGRLDRARTLVANAIETVDSNVGAPAYDRSWYHVRAGQLAFEAGDRVTAQSEFAESLRLDPQNYLAMLFDARMCRAVRDWRCALDMSTRSADIYPLPQTLGYKADAQRALGDAKGAAETDALIGAEQRLFDVRGINDRLLANYYAERGVHLDAALRAARSDYAKRGDEIYADDTLAWVLAAMKRWRQARIFSLRATRLGTQDPEVQYHAAVIALHTGRVSEAKQRFAFALAENPQFHPVYADDARAELAALESR
ncbi:MAG: tetratricopeptide repeat protein [Vulcanimicrobiaceae bacterium]